MSILVSICQNTEIIDRYIPLAQIRSSVKRLLTIKFEIIVVLNNQHFQITLTQDHVLWLRKKDKSQFLVPGITKSLVNLVNTITILMFKLPKIEQ
jgi:hypothetical protein